VASFLFVVFKPEEQQVAHPRLGHADGQEHHANVPVIQLDLTVDLVLLGLMEDSQSRIDDLTPITNEGRPHLGVIPDPDSELHLNNREPDSSTPQSQRPVHF
jgi:hypothetical protein